ncbi:hypothetical protein F3F96_03225 [Mariprofundus sp. NF]|uniref:hypothetical protein n=1 Tax=Mariprofundus sp. NF TaxID=2608716 RepID=UPI0015A25C49|nr:hypothetical protein [Mariprofundus sp. NF]NWF38148.1 hypothetical protein [Mariprofundus sp. NF]
MASESRQLVLNTDRLSWHVLVFLVAIELLLVLLDIVINYAEVIEYRSIHRIFNIAREDGLAGWFMTSQTLVAALVLWLLYWLSCTVDGATALQRRGWLVLALFFSYMSADDGALIHERLGTMFEEIVAESGNGGDVGILSQWLEMFPSYEWQFLLPFFAAVGLYMLYFLWRVLGVGRPLLMVIAAFSCLAVAVVLDFIEGMPKEHALNLYSWLKEAYMLEDYTVDHFAKSLEEFLEMVGISLFLAVFVAQVGRVHDDSTTLQLASSDSLGSA